MTEVSLRGVRKSYGDLEVIHGIDMEIADGEFIVIVGPSGCGKSTLLRMVAGLEQITGGEVSIGGRVVNNLEPKDRDIAMVFQNYALYPHMSVYQNMAYGLKIRRMSKEEIEQRVQKAAKTLELSHLLERKPRQLSGGQRQRVAMGRSNLDAKLRVQMRLEIKKLQRQLGTTSIYVTHDQVEAMTLADRLIVMNAGVAEQIGSPLEVYDHPATTYVASFIGSPSMNFLPAKLSSGGSMVAIGGSSSAALPLGHSLGGQDGRDVTLGIRPEHLQPNTGGGSHVDLRVDMVEPLGADTLVHGRFVAADADVTLRLPGTAKCKPGDVLPLSADPTRLHVFDKETGRRLG
jgi:sn-glycerol 3-phosphate transport system ATP-binding protein